MAEFWLGVAAGGSLAAVVTVWLCWWLHRRHTDALELLAIRMETLQRTQYESDVQWRRRAAEWDRFAGQVLSESDQQGRLMEMLPSHSALRRGGS
ncbi:hypothetical protein AB0M20_33090 [Actinoplanes sp. NPDC051633]|uniref:hypothetical protein n=1 Tax=Actinoplanes sp. NPDC051633 TaxID=3155670 RepID=UPI003430ABDA